MAEWRASGSMGISSAVKQHLAYVDLSPNSRQFLWKIVE
jgi:hypothetical protein